MKRRCCLAVAVLLLAVPAAVAQTSERVNVSLVEVPVTVADGSGNAVRGLKAENFELSDDRGARAIASFEVVDFTAATPGAVPPPARRNFLLLFDLSNSMPNAMARARHAAEEFVKASVHASDLVAVGTITVERGFRMVTAFTSDRALLAAAVADPANFIVSDPLGIANGPAWSRPVGGVLTADIAGEPGRCFW
jgi:VWFA-related protein